MSADRLGCLHAVRSGSKCAKGGVTNIVEHGSALLKVFELLSEARDRKETEELTTVSIMKGEQGCILQGGRAKLPSTMKTTTWSAFHRFRVSEGIWSKWVSYLKFLNAPEDKVQIREIALQVLLRRALMHEMALMKQPKPAEPCRVILTDMEKNAISDMTGYVIKKLTQITIKHQAAKTGTSFC